MCFISGLLPNSWDHLGHGPTVWCLNMSLISEIPNPGRWTSGFETVSKLFVLFNDCTWLIVDRMTCNSNLLMIGPPFLMVNPPFLMALARMVWCMWWQSWLSGFLGLQNCCPPAFQDFLGSKMVQDFPRCSRFLYTVLFENFEIMHLVFSFQIS